MIAISLLLQPAAAFRPASRPAQHLSWPGMPATAVERWGVFTLSLTGPPDSPSKNAFEIAINATFALAGSRSNFTVLGFYDSSSTYRIRFSPPQEGTWHYVTHSSEEALAGHVGEFAATPASLSNHGPVESRGFELVHADGTPHLSIGTTCYQWSSMDPSMQKQTLATLSASPFNKSAQSLNTIPRYKPSQAPLSEVSIACCTPSAASCAPCAPMLPRYPAVPRSHATGATPQYPASAHRHHRLLPPAVRMTVFPKWYPYNHQNPVQAGYTPHALLPKLRTSCTPCPVAAFGHCPSLATALCSLRSPL